MGQDVQNTLPNEPTYKRSATTDGQIIWYNSKPDENITLYMLAWHAAYNLTRSEMMTHKVPFHGHITSHHIT